MDIRHGWVIAQVCALALMTAAFATSSPGTKSRTPSPSPTSSALPITTVPSGTSQAASPTSSSSSTANAALSWSSTSVQVFDSGLNDYWVSCATVTFCIAADNFGDSAVYGIHGWSPPAVLDTISDSGPALVATTGCPVSPQATV